MALIVSSTTDTQEQVNEAAGVETVEVEEQEQPQEQAQRPPKVPPEPPEPDEDSEEQPDEEQPPAPKKTGGFQRKIERLQQKVAELEMERRYAALHQQQQQPPQQQQRPANVEPKQEEFADYETYDNARIEYRVTQALNAREKQLEQQRAQQREQEQVQSWHQRVGSFRNEVQDFDDVLGNVDHIEIPRPLQTAIMEDDMGPRLAYELARQPEIFEKIARQPSLLAGVKALGEFKASLTAKAAPPRKPVSNAPEPIRPVANGANGTVHKSLDQLPLADYVRMRNKQEAARRNQ